MGDAGELKCASVNCGRLADLISARTGKPICYQCHEFVDLALPHVPLWVRWRRWRADARSGWRGGRAAVDRAIAEIEAHEAE